MYADGVVQFQRGYGCATDAGSTDDKGAEQFKMFFPILRARIEERSYLIINWVKGCDFRAFVFITFETGKRQILNACCAVIFARDDVIYLVCEV